MADMEVNTKKTVMMKIITIYTSIAQNQEIPVVHLVPYFNSFYKIPPGTEPQILVSKRVRTVHFTATNLKNSGQIVVPNLLQHSHTL